MRISKAAGRGRGGLVSARAGDARSQIRKSEIYHIVEKTLGLPKTQPGVVSQRGATAPVRLRTGLRGGISTAALRTRGNLRTRGGAVGLRSASARKRLQTTAGRPLRISISQSVSNKPDRPQVGGNFLIQADTDSNSDCYVVEPDEEPSFSGNSSAQSIRRRRGGPRARGTICTDTLQRHITSGLGQRKMAQMKRRRNRDERVFEAAASVFYNAVMNSHFSDSHPSDRPARRAPPARLRQPPQVKVKRRLRQQPTQVVDDDVMEIDVDDDVIEVRPKQSAKLVRQIPNNRAPTYVSVNNLAESVSLTDIQELFSIHGELTTVRFHRPGLAIVGYVRRQDALAAKNELDDRAFDGSVMEIRILRSPPPPAAKPSASPPITARIASPAVATPHSDASTSGTCRLRGADAGPKDGDLEPTEAERNQLKKLQAKRARVVPRLNIEPDRSLISDALFAAKDKAATKKTKADDCVFTVKV